MMWQLYQGLSINRACPKNITFWMFTIFFIMLKNETITSFTPFFLASFEKNIVCQITAQAAWHGNATNPDDQGHMPFISDTTIQHIFRWNQKS
jgi:hypothetical protein